MLKLEVLWRQQAIEAARHAWMKESAPHDLDAELAYSEASGFVAALMSGLPPSNDADRMALIVLRAFMLIDDPPATADPIICEEFVPSPILCTECGKPITSNFAAKAGGMGWMHPIECPELTEDEAINQQARARQG